MTTAEVFTRISIERLDSVGIDDMTLLSAAEIARLDSMAHPTRHRQFIAGRVLSRRLIGALNHDCGPHPSIAVTPLGKPFMPDLPGVHLSISHSAEWVACAIASVPVGIDIEVVNAQRATDELIEHVCSQEERRLFESLAPERRDHLFTELWTLKEAWLKCCGAPLDMHRMRAINWTAASAFDGNCVSWTADAFSVTVLGPPAALLRDARLALGAKVGTIRRVEGA